MQGARSRWVNRREAQSSGLRQKFTYLNGTEYVGLGFKNEAEAKISELANWSGGRYSKCHNSSIIGCNLLHDWGFPVTTRKVDPAPRVGLGIQQVLNTH